MHPALTTPEILYAIFEHCSSSRPTLANAALACQAFAEPASEVLWRHQPHGLYPIASTFSKCKWKEYEYVSPRELFSCQECYLVVSGKIPEADWVRFERLAQRVRALQFSRSNRKIHTDFLHILAARFDDRPMFPNLRELIWEPSLGNTGYMAVLKPICLSPVLATVSMSPSFGYLKRDIPIVADMRQGLTHLSVNDAVSGEVEEVLVKFTNLRTLHLGGASVYLWRALSGFEHLQVFKCDELKVPRCANAVSFPIGFPTLERLSLTMDIDHDHLPTFVRMLSAISSTRLTSVALSYSQIYLQEAGYDAAARLGRLAAFQGLRELSLTVSFVHLYGSSLPSVSPPPRSVAFADVFAKFFPLHQLRAFRLDVFVANCESSVHTTCDLSSDDVASIASAWPHLVRLSIQCRRWESAEAISRAKRPSLSSLAALAWACPDLEELDVEYANVKVEDVLYLVTQARAASIVGANIDTGSRGQRQRALRRLVPELRRSEFGT